MFGMYKKLTREFTGTFTGKGLEFGGSLIRPEATGFGGLYFVNQMLQTKGIDIKGKTVAISGFGNVAWGAATKATELGAKVVTISGPTDISMIRMESVERRSIICLSCVLRATILWLRMQMNFRVLHS